MILTHRLTAAPLLVCVPSVVLQSSDLWFHFIGSSNYFSVIIFNRFTGTWQQQHLIRNTREKEIGNTEELHKGLSSVLISSAHKLKFSNTIKIIYNCESKQHLVIIQGIK